MNSITREVASERLANNNWEAQESLTVESILNILFSPPFIPKGGEVIAVSFNRRTWHLRKFIKMSGDLYMCRPDHTSESCLWTHARPPTDKERRV